MIKIGLTGGIACGKSTIAKIIAEMGVPVLDADQVARDVVSVGSDGLTEIRKHFGDDICLDTGELDRLKLRNIIISNPEAKKKLESITHPRIFMSMLKWQQTQEATGHSVTLVEAALMVETGSYKMYDALIVATCTADIQRKRLMTRNAIDATTAQQWMDSQMPLSEKEALADLIVHNNRGLDELRQVVQAEWPLLLQRLQKNH